MAGRHRFGLDSAGSISQTHFLPEKVIMNILSHSLAAPGSRSEKQERLGWYVYTYRDPETKEVIYVGKGKSNRIDTHKNKANNHKLKIAIDSIANRGLKPIVEYIRWGLTEETSFEVEAACIDLFAGTPALCNAIAGKWSKRGRIKDSDIEAVISVRDIEITDAAIGFPISKTYFNGMPAIALYDATRAIWKPKEQVRVASKGQLAFAIYEGQIVEVYTIAAWLPAKSTLNPRWQTDPLLQNQDPCNFFEFVGRIAAESMRKKYLYARPTKQSKGLHVLYGSLAE